MKNKLRLVGIFLLLIAGLPYAYVQYRLRSHHWEALNASAKLEDGSSFVTAYFPTDLTGFYKVSITFAPIDVSLEDCLIGYRLSGTCADKNSGMDLNWSVLRRGSHGETVVVDRRPYRPALFGGAGVVETGLGDFDAHKGDEYRIALNVKRLAPQLRSASPHIRVEAGTIYWEKWIIFSQVFLLFGAVVGFLGLAALLISFPWQGNQSPMAE